MNQERIFIVLKGPHVSEKATLVADLNNQYVFKVAPDATKIEIKAAVEALFEVSVTKVNVLNMKGKTKRTAKGMGKRNDVRKAYVTLAEGQEISFVAGE
jgi:large subunit ribosomal protein L23|tara:strand:+ start:1872 stop:2168 length:297 start_codon:yes stop_codon:yes gene_type:complete